MTYRQRVFKRCHSDKHFSEFFLQDGGKKSNGIDMEQNYVTVTLCITRQNASSKMAKIYRVIQTKLNQFVKEYVQQSVFKRHHIYFSEFLHTIWRQKSNGIDMKLNYVTVTLSVARIHVSWTNCTEDASWTRLKLFPVDFDAVSSTVHNRTFATHWQTYFVSKMEAWIGFYTVSTSNMK